jgi:hypothetical protein
MLEARTSGDDTDADCAELALAYVRALVPRNTNPLAALLGDCTVPTVDHQYPEPGINWLNAELGFYYHSHGHGRSKTGEHGHFHLFARASARGRPATEAFTHLLAVAVDGKGMPVRCFTTNLWVTGGLWRSARFVLARLEDFGRLAGCSSVGSGRWLGMMLVLHAPLVRRVINQREARTRSWRHQGALPRRLADRRVEIMSETSMTANEGKES